MKRTSKKERDLQQITAFKARFEKKSTDWLLNHRNSPGPLMKPAWTALRQVLEERGVKREDQK